MARKRDVAKRGPKPPSIPELPTEAPAERSVPSMRKARWAAHFLRTFNQSRAALDAKLASTRKSASVMGVVMMRDPYVRELIARGMARRNEELHIDAQWALRELFLLYSCSIADLFELEQDENGEWRYTNKLDLNNAPPEVLARVNEVRFAADGTVNVRMPDKIRVLELIGKHIDVSAFEDKVSLEVRHQQDVITRLHEGRERVAKMRLAADEGRVIEGEVDE